MLTGQLGATSGDAVVWGHSVRDSLHKVNKKYSQNRPESCIAPQLAHGAGTFYSAATRNGTRPGWARRDTYPTATEKDGILNYIQYLVQRSERRTN